MSEPTLMGFHHVTINVQDVERSEQWYEEVLGFARATRYSTDSYERLVMRHPDSAMVLGLSTHHVDVAREPFDERRAGLDHVAFRAASREVLEEWVSRLDRLGVAHSEIKPASIPGSFLITFRDPDNTQLEIFVSPT
jgi:glyoxylase I family protein